MQLTHLLDGQRDWVTLCLRPFSFVMSSYGPFLRFSMLLFYSGDQSIQHIFSHLSFFALVPRFRKWSFLRKLVW